VSLAMLRTDGNVAAEQVQPERPAPLPISKLRGVPNALRVALKSRRITNCDQLLATAAKSQGRAMLARQIVVDDESLLILVQRADMARVNGVGAVFGMMLEDLGIYAVDSLAETVPAELHEKLRAYNQAERIARRSPTPDEVADWIAQARALPVILT
jgi:predicted flap endonuclease-1-like 5' DNA nuclease